METIAGAGTLGPVDELKASETMLKSAAEMAAAARAAKEEATNLERMKRGEEGRAVAKQQEAAARLDRVHRAFEPQAFAAARTGQLGLAVASVDLNLNRLREQGFVAERLSRRNSFEEHLAALLNTKIEQLAELCERIASSLPGLTRIEGDDLLHRNPLISLLETLWRRGELNEPFDLDLLLAFARIQTAVNITALEGMRPQIGQALRVFADLKATEAKYQRVRWENLMIPQEANQATYVTWESAEDGEGMALAFSAKRLKWLVIRWPELAAPIGTNIEEEAQRGQTNLTAFVWRTTGTWNVSWDWPPDAWMADDDREGQDLHSATDSTWEGDLFCDPKLAAEELMSAGYEVNIEPMAIGNAADSSPAESYLAACAGEAYVLTIRWP